MRRAFTLLIIFCAVFFMASVSYSSVKPNDTFYNKQWGLKAVHAPAVWEITKGSANVNVAVIDSGIEPGHDDISGNLDDEKCRNFVGGILKPDESAYTDENGHGTHVAGIIAARGNNSRGIAGMSWSANLIAIRGDTNINAFVKAVNYIIGLLEADPSMKIIVNISLVHEDKTPPAQASNESNELWKAMHELDQTGRALVCVSAGNNGINIGIPAPEASKVPGEEIKEGMYVYPAAFQGINNMIVVANAMRTGSGTEYTLSERSNYNKNIVHIAAPGTNIYSCVSSKHEEKFDAQSHDLQADGDYLYVRMDGTSMASPFAAGTAALLLSAYPEKTMAEIRSAILNGANAYYISDSTIYGFLDAKGAFDAMDGINVKAGLPVDELQFPDDAFRDYVLKNIDSNNDSRLDANEISATMSIDLSGLSVSDLQGIEYFTALEELDCSGTNIEALPEKKEIPNVTAINASNCANLGAVLFDGSEQDGAKLVSLNVSGCTSLAKIECGSNDISALDVSGCPALEELWCDYNKLAYLDVSSCPKLTELHCEHNSLTALDMYQDFTGTAEFDGQKRPLAILHESSDGKTFSADISGFIPAGKLGRVTNITASILSASDNDSQPTGISPHDGYNISYNSSRGIITITGKTSGKISKPTRLRYVYKTGSVCAMGVIVYVISRADNNPEIPPEAISGDAVIDANTFPDPKFLAYVKRFDTDNDGTFSEAEISAVKHITVQSMNIESLKGIERFTSLISLDCYSNNISGFDISNLTRLRYLNCNNNKFVNLSITNHPALEYISCVSSTLTEIDLSGCSSLKTIPLSNAKNITKLNISNTAITRLTAPGTALKELDAENCTLLESLHCDNNQITRLNVNSCTALESLYCRGNKLESFDVSTCSALKHLDCDKNSLSEINVKGCNALETLRCDGNSLTSLDVSECTSLKSLYCRDNSLSEMNISGCKSIEQIYCSGNQLQEFSAENYAALKILDCSNNPLTVLNVKGCTSLVNMICAGNPLQKVDISGCTSMTGFAFGGFVGERKTLIELDASGCTSLISINCDYNQLTRLNISGCVSLDTLNCQENNLSELSIPGCDSLKYLDCYSNPLTSLDIRNAKSLKIVYCYGTNLETLDASGCSALQTLYCYSCDLKEIVLDGCTSLQGLYCYSNDIHHLELSPCTSLRSLNARYNHIAYIDLPGYFDARLHGQTLSGYSLIDTGDSSWPYKFDFRQCVPENRISNIVSGDKIVGDSQKRVQGYSGGEKIRTVYSDGVASFASKPTMIFYCYNADYRHYNSNSSLMDVWISLEDSDNSTNTDNPGNSDTPDNTDTPSDNGNNTNNPGANNAPSDELAGRLRNILGTSGNVPVQNLTRNNASIYRERNNTGEYHAYGSKIAAVLPEIQVSQEGIYIIPVSFDSPIPAGSYLAWHSFSDDIYTAQNDGESCVFLDSDSNELAMPLTHEISSVSAAAYLEADTLYAPCVSYSSVESGNNPGTSSGGSGGGCESFGFMGMILAVAMLIRRQHV